MSPPFEIIKTTSKNNDFIALIQELDKSLWETYPELKSDYWGNNEIEYNENVIVVYQNTVPVGCSCFKKYDNSSIEIKCMFVAPAARGKKIAQLMLQELETWAKTLGYRYSILETLVKQESAIGMYQKVGYQITPNYPPYVGLQNSICMRKSI